MAPKNDCVCRFSTVEVMTEAEKLRYVDKTRCNDCGKVSYLRIPRVPTGTAGEVQAQAQAQADDEELAAREAEEEVAVG